MEKQRKLSRKKSNRKISTSIQHKESFISLATSVNELLQETKKYDKYHRYSAKLQYIFVFVMGVLYLFYGITRYISSRNHHQINTFIIDTDTSYPVPVSMVCQDASLHTNNPFTDHHQSSFHIINKSFVNITQLVVDRSAMSIIPFLDPKIKFVTDPKEILNLSIWNVVDFNPSETFPYYYNGTILLFNVTVIFQCQIILPPKDASFEFGYLQSYLYHKPGLGDIDQTLEKFDESIDIPMYMSKQFRYKIIHRIFHFDGLMDSITNRFPSTTTNSLTAAQLCLAAFSYGTTIYAAPWSITNFVLSLVTHKYLKNNLFFSKYNNVDAFDVNTVSSLSEIGAKPAYYNNFSWDSDSSIVSFNHFPHQQNEKLTGYCNISHPKQSQQCETTHNFYHQYDEEYLDYTFFDLLSGLGGIVTGSFSLSAMIIKFLLYGFTCCKWKFKGLAPYPSMSEADKVQLSRFHKMENSASDRIPNLN